jgi:DNA polymerase
VIELVDPPVIATLGSVALDAIKVIEPHAMTLKTSAGTIADWNSRTLVPLYHPSPQVIAAQRGLLLQLEHFRKLGTVHSRIADNG